MGLLRMPDSLRGELSKTFGILLTGTPGENVQSALRIIRSRRPPKVIIVGDFTLHHFLEAGFRPDIGIFDTKTRRSDFVGAIDVADAIRVRNPQGCITDGAAAALGRALLSGEPAMILVDGEEDLLSLTAIEKSPLGSLVIYGMPKRGMIVLTVDEEIKERIGGLLKKFTREE
ncbi:MAG TPA: DUF359 domain-containing protein [Candidatus Methanomethylicus sp.]|nr:DUF359 domain-containing protein [Candidatus Methanomethylicus sp.]HRU81266.1 DUF359 domain-containing protein [Candidatus Methanomethylicus sp.]